MRDDQDSRTDHGSQRRTVTELAVHEVTHRQALAALPSEDLLNLRQLADLPGLARLALQFGCLAVFAFAIVSVGSSWLLLPLLLLHGICLVFLFAPLHEAIHGTAFRSSWLNQAVAELLGFLLLLPPRYFRAFHFAHHRHTQDPQRDPELVSPKPQTLRQYLLTISGYHYWRGCGDRKSVV